MATFRVSTTDLSKPEAGFVVEAARLIWDKIPTDANAREVLAERLKQVLDMKFKPSWHVLCGSSMGFALKSRRKSSIVINGPRHIQIVCWRSPGHEIVSSEVVKLLAERKLRPSEQSVAPLTKSFKVVQQPQLGDLDFSPDLSEALQSIDKLISSEEIEDVQKLAQEIRTRLTAILHPIWHVILGSDFRISSSAELTHEIIIKKGKLKIHCFKHTEMSPDAGTLAAAASSWQSVIFALACIAYMIHSRLCTGERRLSLCPAEGSQIPSAVATGLIVIIVLQQANKLVFKK